ncbi:MAG TPA: DUF2958 domain-containing protein [bacterium]|mgnify:CR=1 FL=1|nr:DUF2958 domain-containing protein [bacterium]HQJ66283.1 DUF2958 domain-containing protein [bacterium]
MKLFTREIERKLQAQFKRGDDPEQLVHCKIFNPYGQGTWFIVNQDPEDPDYLWAIVDLFEIEEGSVLKSELELCRVKFGGFQLPLERDLYWKPKTVREVWADLRSKHQHLEPACEPRS